jgi:protein-tyrosine phosphatase
MAEFLVRRQIEAHGLPVHVSSAGTHANPDLPMHRLAHQALAALNIEPAPFLSRPLTHAIVERSSLILTMTDAQRSWVVNNFPHAVRRTYLLSQFSRLVGATPDPGPLAPSEWGPSLLSRALEGRTLVQPLIEGRDIEDPVGRPPRQFQSCAGIIEQRIQPLFTRTTLIGGQ